MIEIFLWVTLFLTAVIVHEVSHGFVANLLGDPTAKDAGRLTLNPIRHVDPFWTILLPALLFISTQGRFAIGMAKPVPVNFERLANRRMGMVAVAFAGPAANILLAILSTLLWKRTASNIFLLSVYLNLGLAIFNLIPIPPLDGSKVVAGLMPRTWARQFLKLEPFGFIIILGVYFLGGLYYMTIPVLDLFCRLLGIPRIGVHF